VSAVGVSEGAAMVVDAIDGGGAAAALARLRAAARPPAEGAAGMDGHRAGRTTVATLGRAMEPPR
jgi:hypothetical protein